VRAASLVFTATIALAAGATSALSRAQEPVFDGPPPFAENPAPRAAAPTTPIGPSDAANIYGCEVIARIDGQIVQACEVLWHVNKRIEQNQDRIPPEQVGQIRQELLRLEVGGLLDRKLLYGEFLHSNPAAAENLPQIVEKLREPFQKREVPMLMKELDVQTPVELERELTRLGSSMADVRQAFNEKAIASEWLRTQIKINEQVTPDELLAYYQSHLSDYDEPTRVRWEELVVRKSRFDSPAEAYAEIANLGNEVWRRAAAKSELRGPAFIEVAKARSDGYRAKENGGQHDWTAQGALKIEAIDRALFTLQVGQMSNILVTDDAFYIVRVLERKEAGRKPFTEVQSEIRERLKEERFNKKMEEYLGQLRKNARVWTAFTGNISAEELIARRQNGATQR
jgi:hypothetical protein